MPEPISRIIENTSGWPSAFEVRLADYRDTPLIGVEEIPSLGLRQKKNPADFSGA